MATLDTIRNERLVKAQKMKEADFEPYPARVDVSHSIRQASELYSDKKAAEVCIAGRVMSIRGHGGSTFLTIEDSSGSMQVWLKKDILTEKKYSFLTSILDIGDFFRAEGRVVKTKKGEVTVECSDASIISKALRPLPEKWVGLKDQEKRFRRRYVDLIVNEDVRDIFKKRAQLISALRDYLEGNDFLEVEIPVLEHTTGGADAEPFITHHNKLDQDFFLRISLELPLKRLLVGGMDKVYELGRVFRNEGISTEHLQEFTMLEFYWAYKDYSFGMVFVENMYSKVVKKVTGSTTVMYGEHKLDFAPPWPRNTYVELFSKYVGVNLLELIGDTKKLIDALNSKYKLTDIDISLGWGRIVDQVYKKFIRPQLISPQFLIDHPQLISPLAKRKSDNPDLVERFQVLIAGSEVGNGYSELNDPIDQRERFEAQRKLRESGDKEAQMMDTDFIEALEYGMPPAFGFGVGIDRLLMILTNSSSIREVVLFPMMRRKENESE